MVVDMVVKVERTTDGFRLSHYATRVHMPYGDKAGHWWNRAYAKEAKRRLLEIFGIERHQIRFKHLN